MKFQNLKAPIRILMKKIESLKHQVFGFQKTVYLNYFGKA